MNSSKMLKIKFSQKKILKKKSEHILTQNHIKNIKKTRKFFKQQNELNHMNKMSIKYIKYFILRII